MRFLGPTLILVLTTTPLKADVTVNIDLPLHGGQAPALEIGAGAEPGSITPQLPITAPPVSSVPITPLMDTKTELGVTIGAERLTRQLSHQLTDTLNTIPQATAVTDNLKLDDRLPTGQALLTLNQLPAEQVDAMQQPKGELCFLMVGESGLNLDFGTGTPGQSIQRIAYVDVLVNRNTRFKLSSFSTDTQELEGQSYSGWGTGERQTVEIPITWTPRSGKRLKADIQAHLACGDRATP